MNGREKNRRIAREIAKTCLKITLYFSLNGGVLQIISVY